MGPEIISPTNPFYEGSVPFCNKELPWYKSLQRPSPPHPAQCHHFPFGRQRKRRKRPLQTSALKQERPKTFHLPWILAPHTAPCPFWHQVLWGTCKRKGESSSSTIPVLGSKERNRNTVLAHSHSWCHLRWGSYSLCPSCHCRTIHLWEGMGSSRCVGHLFISRNHL